MDPITIKILSIVQTILLLMSQLLAAQPVAPFPTVSDRPFLPKTEFVQKIVTSDELKLGAYNPSAGGTYRLKSSVGTTDTTIPLSSFKEPISNIAYTIAYLNSTIEYGTLEPGNSTKKELISFTGITQNSDGTATLTGVTRGLGFSYPYTASTTLQLTHSGQSVFILSDAPGLFTQYANKANTELISGDWAFSTAPTSTDECSATAEYCTKAYIDALGVQGAATSTETNLGVVELATNSDIADSIASSTFGGPLAIPTRVSSSTYNALYTTVIPVTKTNDGLVNTIDPNFIATTSAYTFSTTTHYVLNAGTIFASSTATFPSLTLNGIAYTFPATGGASSTVLMQTNTANTLTWQQPDWRLLARETFGATATNTISFAPATNLKVIISSQGNSTANSPIMVPNTTTFKETGALFGARTDNNYALVSTQGAQVDGQTLWGLATTSPFYMTMDISNATGTNKVATYEAAYNATGPAAPQHGTGTWTWATTTAQISSLSFKANRDGADAWTTGMEISVFGSSF